MHAQAGLRSGVGGLQALFLAFVLRVIIVHGFTATCFSKELKVGRRHQS